ncbi:MAG: hypothetical protein IJD16_01745 [Desulfovibrio sp.]|nr:hypothetical protein [Desulfovibrio sp.]
MRRMFFSICLALLFWGQACHAATEAESLYGTAPGQHNQGSTVVNGDVYIDNSNGMIPGFAGTWRDPESGDIITSVIAPRQQMVPPGQNNLYAPYMSGNGYYGSDSSDRHPQGHRPGFRPDHRPDHRPGRHPAYPPVQYPGQYPGHAMPPQMTPGAMPGMPPTAMQPQRPGTPAPMPPGMRPGMPGGFPGGGR